jgi:hypothetical protein
MEGFNVRRAWCEIGEKLMMMPQEARKRSERMVEEDERGARGD